MFLFEVFILFNVHLGFSRPLVFIGVMHLIYVDTSSQSSFVSYLCHSLPNRLRCTLSYIPLVMPYTSTRSNNSILHFLLRPGAYNSPPDLYPHPGLELQRSMPIRSLQLRLDILPRRHNLIPWRSFLAHAARDRLHKYSPHPDSKSLAGIVTEETSKTPQGYF